MLSFFIEKITLRLGQDGFYLSQRNSRLFSRASSRDALTEFIPWPTGLNDESSEHFDTKVLGQQLRSLFESHFQTYKLRSIELVISDSWVRHFLVPPLKNARRLSDYSAAMEKRYFDIYIDDIGNWQLQMDSSLSGASLACGLPKKLIDTCAQICREYKLQIIGLRSEFIENLNWLASSGIPIKADDWICVRSQESYLILVCDLDGWHRLIGVTHLEFSRTSQLASTLSRLALLHTLEVPARFVLIGEEKPQWHAQMTQLEGAWMYQGSAQKKQGENVT